MQVAEDPLPERLQLASGLNVPVLFVAKVTVPDGVSVPGDASETVTMHVA